MILGRYSRELRRLPETRLACTAEIDIKQDKHKIDYIVYFSLILNLKITFIEYNDLVINISSIRSGSNPSSGFE